MVVSDLSLSFSEFCCALYWLIILGFVGSLTFFVLSPRRGFRTLFYGTKVECSTELAIYGIWSVVPVWFCPSRVQMIAVSFVICDSLLLSIPGCTKPITILLLCLLMLYWWRYWLILSKAHWWPKYTASLDSWVWQILLHYFWCFRSAKSPSTRT